MNTKSNTLSLFVLALWWLGPPVQGGNVRINELMYHPGYGKAGDVGYVPEDTLKEYLELYNSGTNAVNLKGWRLKQGVSFTFPDVTIGPGGYLVVTADSDINRFKESYRPSYPAVVNANVVGGWTGKLSNNGDDIELEDNFGNRVDFVSYANEGDWAWRRPGDPYPGEPAWWRGWKWTTGADAGGKSLELIDLALPNNCGQNWAASLNDGGTPGGPNSVVSSDIAPILLDVKHLPLIPKSTELVTVTARVVDELSGSVSVTLHYRLDGVAAFTSVPMFDDGQHGDGAGGDGVYGARLPAQPDKVIVQFYVQASDAGGKTRTWPGPTDDQGTQGANALYQVDDSVYGGRQPVCRIVVTDAEWKAWLNLMDNISNGRYSDAEMNATLVLVDGVSTEVRYNVSVRNRGAGTRSAQPHNFHVGIPGDRPWRNLTELDLNTRTVHSQVAANAIFAMTGLPNTYGAPIQVRVNGNNLAHLTPTGDVDSYQFGSYYWFQPYGTEWARDHLPEDAGGNVYRGVWYFDGVKLANGGADLHYLGDDPADYRQIYSPLGPSATSGAYSKRTNTAADDWSDLINLVKMLNNAPDASYSDEINQVVNADEWLRYFAVCSLIGNMETTLGTGVGDDYSLYRGVVDARFQVLTHDLDTTLGQGDTGPDYGRSIFKAADLPAVGRFLKHPAFAPRYYAILKELIDTTFAPAQMNPLLDQWLGGWVPEATAQSMKDFVALRRENVLSQIPLRLSVTSPLQPAGGYPRASISTTSLSGQANAIHTRSVLVNGINAAWTPWSATWSATGVTLLPGINRLLIQALDADGREIDRSVIDVWYDRGAETSVAGGTLPADTTWTAAGGPYRLASNLTIPPGRILTIEPGTTVYFDSGVGITVNGQLVAQGMENQRIRFTQSPGSGARWAGFQFVNARQPNAIAYADMEYGGSGGVSLSIHNSQVLFDRMTFFHMDNQITDIWEPQVIIRHCTFGDIGGHYMNMVEHMLPDGWFIVEGNLFGKNTGDNDIFHLNHVSVKGGATTLVLNNVFTGAGDDIVDDNETDTHIEGNLFMHAKELNSSNHGASAAVTTGPGGNLGQNQEPDNLLTQHLTVVRNVFFMNDYGIINKTGASAWIYNNAFVGNNGAIMFDEIDRTADAGPGRSAYIESCIFWHNKPESLTNGTLVVLNDPRALETGRLSRGQPQVTVNNSILPTSYHYLGAGNLDVDPAFVSPSHDFDLNVADPQFAAGFDGFDSSAFLMTNGLIPDMHLQPNSPAIGAGFNGVDMGLYVSANASIAGEPRSLTSQTSATLTVGGTDLYGYKYRVLGAGFSGAWSNEKQQMEVVTQITLSGALATATVTNHGYANGDVIQVMGADALAPYYNGTFTIGNVTPNTFDYSVALDTNAPMNELPPKDIWCRKPEAVRLSGLTGGTYTVEVIRKNSLGVWQSETQATSASWTVDSTLAPRVRLNEILADNYSAVAHGDGFPDLIELYNESSAPVDLSGMALTDAATNHSQFVFPAGTSLAGNAYLVLYADNDNTTPGIHLGFALNRTGDAVFLYDKPANGGTLLDSVSFGPQLPDLSIGRLADGQWGLTKPTFGSANVPQPTGEPAALRINEWLTDARTLFLTGFIELYNPDLLPVPLGGLFLTDNPVGWPDQHKIAALSFISGNGFAAFIADAQTNNGGNHLNFSLSSQPGMIGLFDANTNQIDWIIYGPQQTDVSEGRSPNGAAFLTFFDQPTPGAGNPGAAGNTNVTTQVFNLVAITNVWNYNQAGVDLGTNWHNVGYPNEATWPTGPALLYAGANSYPAPANTPLSLTTPSGAHVITYYFRTHFNISTNLSDATLNAYTVIDDGAVFYLNGAEALPVGMPDTPISYSTRPTRTVGTIALEGPFALRTNNLIVGDNVLAVEVHQISDTSHDIAFGMALTATVTTTNLSTNASPAAVVLNEVLAKGGLATGTSGSTADSIELFNPSAQAADLIDMSLTDEVGTPRKWVFPTNSAIPGFGYMVIQCDGHSPASGTNTGFSLQASGGAVYLFAALAQGGGLVDSVTYGLQVPDLSIGRAGSQGSWTLTQPTPGAPNVAVELGSTSALKINEWMAKAITGPDWFELYNASGQPVELSGLGLTVDLNNPTQSPVPPLSFIGTGANAFQKFIADKTPSQGANHVSFKLSAKGSSLGVFTANGVSLDTITFGAQTQGVSQGRLPDGSANVVSFPTTPTPGESNYQPLPGVVINEVLSHTDPPLEDALEFYNPMGTSQPVGGWYVSNTQQDFKKYRIPDGTVVPAQGYLVLYEYQFDGGPGSLVPFTFNSAHGDEAWLSAADAAGNLTGLRAKARFGAAANGVSFGRYVTSVGVDFVALSRRTFGVDSPVTLEEFRAGKGAANAYPLVGPVVINEIMFHPPNVGGTNGMDNTVDEFVELLNLTTRPQPLFDPAVPSNTWRLEGGVNFTFPTNVTLPAGGFLLLVSFNPVADPVQLASFQTKYGVPEGIPLYGPYGGKLNNGGDSVELYQPDPPQQPPHPDVGFVPFVLVDRINYSNLTPWPTNADGSGLSLQRKVASVYGNDPINWQAGAPTAGWANLSGGPLKINAVELRGDQVLMRFTAEAGKTYTVQYQTALGNGAWQKLADIPAPSTAQTLEVLDSSANAGSERYYRLVAPAVP